MDQPKRNAKQSLDLLDHIDEAINIIMQIVMMNLINVGRGVMGLGV